MIMNKIRISCLWLAYWWCIPTHAQPIQNMPEITNTTKGTLGSPGRAPEVIPPKVPVAPPPVVVQEVQEIKPPDGSYEEVLFYEKQCRIKKDRTCVIAGNIIMSEKPPKQIFDLDVAVRAKRALRLYEIAIGQDNLEAMEYAYDLYYDSFIVARAFNSYGDKARGLELREVMVSKNYPGGLIRMAQDYLENPEYLLSFGKKKEACQILKQYADSNDLTVSSKQIITNLKIDLTCKII